MKKLFLLTMASLMTVFTMAVGRNDGSTQANAIEFDWDKGITHNGGTLWYRVDLAPLYEEENPSLTLYLTNPSNEVGTSVDVSMTARVAGQEESKDYTIAARQYKTYTANAKTLVTLRQTEIYLTLTSNGTIKLSAKVFEAEDLDETCKDARTLSWGVEATQNPMYSAWWRVSLKPIKEVEAIDGFDAKITITNIGTKKLNLKVGQSLDCPSSGLTKRTYELAPGESVEDTVPRSMINSVQPDELYFGIENVESPISILVEKVKQPTTAIIPAPEDMEELGIGEANLRVTDTIVIPAGKTLYRIKVADMDSLAKYEPEFTYRNQGESTAKVSIKMAFERPAYGTSNTDYTLAPGEEEIVVYKKNMLEGMGNVDSIYLLTIADQPINFYGRFKHVREGKACKTNIDFNWETGHIQEARTTQWYAINVADARDNMKDINVYILNQGAAAATVKASMAFSCPYIDLQEMTRTLSAKGDTLVRRIGFSTYALMTDTVWVGLETSQDIKFWADTIDVQKKEEADHACESAIDFNWEEGIHQNANDTVWYRIDMNAVRESTAKFPTLFMQNLSDQPLTITTEQSLECPDEIENEVRTTKIAANSSYTSKLSRNLFENIVQDELWVRVTGDQEFTLQVRLTEEAAGASCASAIPFNWQSGNVQDANANLWYIIDLRNIMKKGNDLKLHMQNRDNETCKGIVKLAYSCPTEDSPSSQSFTLAGKAERSVTIQNSALETLEDSAVYVNLQGNTSLRFWADTLKVEPFDTIYAEGLTLVPFKWNTVYTQTEDTVWYIIAQSEIDAVRDSEKKLKPVAHIENLSSKDLTIKGEVAFAFPIVKQMMAKSQTIKAKQTISNTIPVSTFDQLLKKDSIILRVTRPVGAGDFQFGVDTISAYNGNKREDALPILLGEKFTQSPNTTMWYRLKTEKLKKADLYNKQLYVATKNAGTSDAKITLAVYEGDATTDMLEEFGLNDYRSRTIKKGENRSHNVPAQIVYAVGNVDLYIQVTTTDSLVFETRIAGEYAPAPVDPAQAKAKLLVPNVDYVVDGDNEEHWYQLCLPYIFNNYKYAHACSLTYELDGEATIETTATFQDNMDCQMPVRKRTINKSGKHYKNTRPLYELLNKGIKRFANQSIDVSTFQEDFIDELLRRYITSDSITGYIRIKTSANLKIRLNMPQTTGDACDHPMEFDWEHGNVNPKGATNWIHVRLDENRVPEGKDLKLHMDNWTTGSTNVSAIIYEEADACKANAELGSVQKLMETDSIIKIIDRDLLEIMGWPGLMIKYTSDSVTHIWADFEDHVRDTIFDTIPNLFVCPNSEYIDSIGKVHVINPDDEESWHFTVFKDSTFLNEGKIKTFAWTYNIYPKAKPELPAIGSLIGQPSVADSIVDVTAATAELRSIFDDPSLGDTIMKIGGADSLKWEYCIDGSNWLDVTADKLSTNALALRYVVTTECGDVLTSGLWLNIPNIDLEVTACDSYTWDFNGITYTESTVVVETENLNSLTKQTRTLKLTINNSTTSEETITACESYEWHGVVYAADGDYTFTTTNVVGCDSVITLHLTITHVSTGDTIAEACESFEWRGETLTASGDYLDTMQNVAGCDSIVTLHLTINHATEAELTEVACDEFTWDLNGTTYTASGDYKDTIKNVAGCDSIVTLHLTINNKVETAYTINECNEYTWDLNGKTYSKDTVVTDTTTAVNGCDSIVTLTLKFKYPVVFELKAVAKYGNRLLMIDRFAINAATGWDLDSIGALAVADEVTWWRMESAVDTNPQKVGKGYYITNEQDPGEPLVGIYYAVIEIPAEDGSECGTKGETEKLICPQPKTASPALMPSMARPGEDIMIVNLDPEMETTIRIYSTDGMITRTHTVSGVESYVIKAEEAQGIYLVDLRNEDMQSTLRYIVK